MVCSCHNRITQHPCGHKSYKKTYCSAARRRGTFCPNHAITTVQGTRTRCRIAGCQMSRVYCYWRCCHCRQGPNTANTCMCSLRNNAGYIYACSHTVCRDCVYYER
ncbi:hypothetical protein F4808DRAFT_439934 [Astrocystis sublimbata]|nr:hypothetical protein F4808DRAFT_439934 [Astrocystis sublimbata]